MGLFLTEFIIILFWLGIKLTVLIFYNDSNPNSYFAQYIYHSSFAFHFILVFMLMALVIFLIRYKIQELKALRSLKSRVSIALLRIVRPLIYCFILLIFLIYSIQIQSDFKKYISNPIINNILIIDKYELSDGARISNSILPYEITSHDDFYYLYKKTDLILGHSYSIQYFKNHKNENIILGMKEDM
ncbi:hypothetical protein [Paenibacillus sp. HB172176]|uniref:hypothetical protein n=1 Tax=Paenibacillus sp. HB172176 TaxID=2493690 RepID=UPI00143C961A|nr:hypothetical protein [Paenibacillus sp. HB172176]